VNEELFLLLLGFGLLFFWFTAFCLRVLFAGFVCGFCLWGLFVGIGYGHLERGDRCCSFVIADVEKYVLFDNNFAASIM
jgi:hypothetical protein